MRALLILLLLLVQLPAPNACSCFPPEVQARTAQEALQKSSLAVYGRVVEVAASGQARILVLESFKGPSAGSVLDAGPNSGQCETPPFLFGEEILVLSFSEMVTACDKYPREHYLLDALRSIAEKGK